MTLPRFLRRITDATGPLMPGLERSEIGARLEAVTVALRIDDATAALDGQAAGFLFAVNLAARLYPTLLIEAPDELRREAEALAVAIHPGVALAGGDATADVELVWHPGTPTPTRVTVCCTGWTVRIDVTDAAVDACVAAVAMAAAAFGMAQVFRAVFADQLENGRTAPVPWSVNLVTLGPDHVDLPFPEPVEIGRTHLAGCGAIGQAAAAVLATLPATGTLVAVDHDTVDLGNLQRYVLTHDDDTGKDKPGFIERVFQATGIAVEPVPARWGDNEAAGPGARTVLVALDSEPDRIGVQASLPREVYNAWTQQDDIGCSRHERFGTDPCLACLYWPRGKRMNRSERMAHELGEHELRVLSYLAGDVAAGSPLRRDQVLSTLRLQPPPEAKEWTERSILDDLAAHAGVEPDVLEAYRGLTIDFLYRDGVCGELLRLERDEPVSVPLAHQSALAGALLAIGFFVARSPALAAHRPVLTEARYNVLVDNPQTLPLPSSRRHRCLCDDSDFTEAYAERWQGA
jgi:hypothetical protein